MPWDYILTADEVIWFLAHSFEAWQLESMAGQVVEDLAAALTAGRDADADQAAAYAALLLAAAEDAKNIP